MMMMRSILGALMGLALSVTSANAWWDGGHMRVAAMAWEQLTPEAKAEATRLIRLNPDYQEWVAAVPKRPDGTREDIDRYTFIRASVWADDIKLRKAYQDASKGDKATNPGAGDNKCYSDLLIHGYWHYKDIAFSVDGSKLADPDPDKRGHPDQSLRYGHRENRRQYR
ncbi:S1/P1 nuclease [Mesorhizobium sp. ASY16-5R]|uniref:S1/P1 nuclease n=1 Tax=Mesorhizobium sp. ASY16-5R TaxID=3445772 RepID=UPI003F9F6CED